jgi:N-acetylglucosaminyldiphosphoundecaprenol N-acetyl-beta-D-mannosaminyltransferase
MSVVRILGVGVRAQSYDDAITELLSAVRQHRKLRAHFATVHSVVEADKDHRLMAAFESADMVCADGVPLVWVSRLRGAQAAERVCGPDVMLTLSDRGRDLGLRHYYVGGAPGTARQLADRLTKRFPGLLIAGTAAPPFRPPTKDEDQALVRAINEAAPDVVWVGLGSPKQELWAASHAEGLDASLVLPVGAAFDCHSGRLRRAPVVVRRIGMEWLFRLAMEPRRLFRRYFMTNARFLAGLVTEELRRRTGRQGQRNT